MCDGKHILFYLVANDLVCNECNYRDANIDPGDVPTEFHYTQWGLEDAEWCRKKTKLILTDDTATEEDVVLSLHLNESVVVQLLLQIVHIAMHVRFSAAACSLGFKKRQKIKLSTKAFDLSNDIDAQQTPLPLAQVRKMAKFSKATVAVKVLSKGEPIKLDTGKIK